MGLGVLHQLLVVRYLGYEGVDMWWTKLGTWILSMLGIAAGELTSRWAMRAAAATIAFALFLGLFKFSWNLVVNQFGVAAGNVASSMANGDAAMAVQTMRCLMPASTAAALTLVMTVFLQAVIVIWTRRIIFSKLAG